MMNEEMRINPMAIGKPNCVFEAEETMAIRNISNAKNFLRREAKKHVEKYAEYVTHRLLDERRVNATEELSPRMLKVIEYGIDKRQEYLANVEEVLDAFSIVSVREVVYREAHYKTYMEVKYLTSNHLESLLERLMDLVDDVHLMKNQKGFTYDVELLKAQAEYEKAIKHYLNLVGMTWH